MKDNKIAIYMRVGNKTSLELTEEEQKAAFEQLAKEMGYTVTPNEKPIPTVDELKKQGNEVMTLPKDKAWLFVWSSVPLEEETRKLKTENLKRSAEMDGYEIVGVSMTIGRGKKVEDALTELIERELPASGANVIYIKGLRGITIDGYGKVAELYDKAKAKGIEIVAADGSLQGLKDDYDTCSAVLRALDDDESQSEGIIWGDALTPKM